MSTGERGADLPRIGTTVPAHAARRAGPVEWLTDRCVSSAALRWPPDLAASMAREWRVELAVLRADRSTNRLARTWRSLRFAVSLATSPAVEPPGSAAGWRERGTGAGRAAMAVAGFFGVAVLAMALAGQANAGFANIGQHVSGSALNAVVVAMLVLAAAVMAWIGTAVARSGRRPVAEALYTAVPVGAALVLVVGWSASFMSPGWFDIALMGLVWVVTITATAATAARLSAAGHRIGAVAAGVIGALISSDLAGIAGAARMASQVRAGWGYAPAWLPLSVLPNPVTFGHYYGNGLVRFPGGAISGPDLYASTIVLGAVASFAGPLLLCSAFVVARSIRAARTSARRATVAVPAERVRSASTVWLPRIVGITGIAVGVAIWAYVSAEELGPVRLLRFSAFEYQELPWLRLFAIALACASLGLLLSRRAAVALPMLIGFVVFFGTDCALSAAGWRGSLGFAIIVLVSAVTVALLWLLAPRLGTGDADSTRRALVGIAVFASLLVVTDPAARFPTHTDVVLSYLLAAVLWCASITAALAARRAPIARAAAVALVVVPLVVVMLFMSGTAANALYYPRSTFFIQAPLTVLALGTARWNADDRALRSTLVWLLLGVGAAVLSVPASDLVHDNGQELNKLVTLLDNPTGLPAFPSGIATMPGQLLLALGLALALARSTVPRRRPAPVEPAPAVPGTDGLGSDGLAAA